jgi:hypothetical protein
MTARWARIRTEHDDPVVAERVAAALQPDNTSEMATAVDGTAIETKIERETTGGLRATADDYVVNLRVATELANTETHDT